MVTNMNRALRYLLLLQGGYFLVTGIWPLISIETFMTITGPKQDLWLVKTVGAMLSVMAVCLLAYLLEGGSRVYVFIIGILSSAVFATVDFFYSIKGVISKIYQVDGVLQVGFLLTWLSIIGFNNFHDANSKSDFGGGRR